MAITVLSIAFPYAPVGPDAVGGAEQILGDLDEALVAAGNTSLVVACEGSRPAGRLFAVPLPQRPTLDEADKTRCRNLIQSAIDCALRSHRVDMVHIHGMDFDAYALPPELPVLITLHLPIHWYRPEAWRGVSRGAQFCCVSESQRRSCPPELRACPVIENGVALPPIPRTERRENFAVVMGRICPEKNSHAALEAGTLADTQVLLAGQVYPYRQHQDYFREKIEPLLEKSAAAPQHRFLGPLRPRRRQELLAQAKCLLHPTLAPETSSLVAMEALAAGTPVIAYRSGALNEIVDDGITGFLVNSVEEMAEAIRSVRLISRETCRNTAERRFARERMVREYFALYQVLMSTPQTEMRCA